MTEQFNSCDHDGEHNVHNEVHQFIEIHPKRDSEYHVTFAYFKKDVGSKLFGGSMGFANNEDDEVLVSIYSVMAPDTWSAITQAKKIDFARKADNMSNYIHILTDTPPGYNDIPFTYENLNDFREYMVREGNFAEFLLMEPTTIQCVKADNVKLAEEQTQSNVLREHLNVADDVENWLQEGTNGNKEDESE
tara:strand:- start:1154 stop:1726 length:573 start_codon:yes stop_codon:yes gene_type:complete